MKTVIDAVNDLRGDSGRKDFFSSHRYVFINIDRGNYTSGNREPFGDDGYQEVCSIKEFDECLEWCENWQSELNPQFNGMTYDEFCDFKDNPISNLIYDKDGYGYELNALYEFSDYEDFEEFLSSNLISVNSNSSLQFITDDCSYLFCREVKSKLGTITPPKVKLVDGSLYLFDSGSSKGVVGKHYISAMDEPMFSYVNSNRFIEVANCTNIIPLVKG